MAVHRHDSVNRSRAKHLFRLVFPRRKHCEVGAQPMEEDTQKLAASSTESNPARTYTAAENQPTVTSSGQVFRSVKDVLFSASRLAAAEAMKRSKTESE